MGRALLALLLLGSLGGLAYLDIASGYEISIFPLYAIPIGLSCWCFNSWVGLGSALLSTFLWHWADHSSGHLYSAPWISYENACSRLVFFLFVVLTLSYVKRTVEISHEKMRAFSGPLPICTHCRRIGSSDGYWMDFQQYVESNTDAIPRPKICPTCARQHYLASSN